jgi:hypothetical protein
VMNCDEGEAGFVAPNGHEVELLQEASGGWAVFWPNPANADEIEYVGDGPDDDWDTVQISGAATRGELLDIWTVDGSMAVGNWWLTRHLIPDSADVLSDDAIRLARRDMAAAIAFDRAEKLVGDLLLCKDRLPDPGTKGGPLEDIFVAATRALDLCRQQSQQLRAAWMTMLESERAAGRGVAAPAEEEGEEG